MARRKKLVPVSVRKPKLRVTSKGVKLSKPSARIGGKSGINISSKGISASTRTPIGTFNSRTGFHLKRSRKKGCGLVVLALIITLALIFIILV